MDFITSSLLSLSSLDAPRHNASSMALRAAMDANNVCTTLVDTLPNNQFTQHVDALLHDSTAVREWVYTHFYAKYLESVANSIDDKIALSLKSLELIADEYTADRYKQYMNSYIDWIITDINWLNSRESQLQYLIDTIFSLYVSIKEWSEQDEYGFKIRRKDSQLVLSSIDSAVSTLQSVLEVSQNVDEKISETNNVWWIARLPLTTPERSDNTLGLEVTVQDLNDSLLQKNEEYKLAIDSLLQLNRYEVDTTFALSSLEDKLKRTESNLQQVMNSTEGEDMLRRNELEYTLEQLKNRVDSISNDLVSIQRKITEQALVKAELNGTISNLNIKLIKALKDLSQSRNDDVEAHKTAANKKLRETMEEEIKQPYTLLLARRKTVLDSIAQANDQISDLTADKTDSTDEIQQLTQQRKELLQSLYTINQDLLEAHEIYWVYEQSLAYSNQSTASQEVRNLTDRRNALVARRSELSRQRTLFDTAREELTADVISWTQRATLLYALAWEYQQSIENLDLQIQTTDDEIETVSSDIRAQEQIEDFFNDIVEYRNTEALWKLYNSNHQILKWFQKKFNTDTSRLNLMIEALDSELDSLNTQGESLELQMRQISASNNSTEKYEQLQTLNTELTNLRKRMLEIPNDQRKINGRLKAIEDAMNRINQTAVLVVSKKRNSNPESEVISLDSLIKTWDWLAIDSKTTWLQEKGLEQLPDFWSEWETVDRVDTQSQ